MSPQLGMTYGLVEGRGGSSAAAAAARDATPSIRHAANRKGIRAMGEPLYPGASPLHSAGPSLEPIPPRRPRRLPGGWDALQAGAGLEGDGAAVGEVAVDG